MLGDLVNIGGFGLKSFSGTQHAIDQRMESVYLGNDDVGVFLQVGVGQLPG